MKGLFMRLILGPVCILAACFLAAGSAASSREWVVEKANGLAEVLSEGQSWTPLSAGVAIPNDSWVRTGPRGLVLLRRNEETILLKPETLASVVSSEEDLPETVIGQRRGSLLLNIEKRLGKHTTVRTPFLAAIVKGTQFEVDVTESSATVTVLDGIVETVDTRSGDSADVHSGQQVVVSAAGDRPMEVRRTAFESSQGRAAPLTPLRFNLSGDPGEPTGLSVSGGRGLFARDGQGGSEAIKRRAADDGAPGKGLMSNALILIVIGSVLILWLLRTIGLVLDFSGGEARGGGSRGGFRKKR